MPSGRTVSDRGTRYFAFMRADRIREGDAVLHEGVFRTVSKPPVSEPVGERGQLVSIALENRESPLCTRPPTRLVVRRFIALPTRRRESTR